MQFLRIADVIKKMNRCQSQLYKEVRAGKFPAPVSLGTGRIRGWEAGEIDRMMRVLLRGGSDEDRRAEAAQIEKDRELV